MSLPILAIFLLTAGAPERIAVMDVAVRAGVAANVGQTLSDDLVTEVRKRRPQASVIGAEEIRSMLAMQGERQKLGCHNGNEIACLSEIGGALGAEEMVTSTLGKLGRTYVFSIKLLDVPHARVVREASQKLATKDEDDLLDAVSKLVAQLLPPIAAPPPAVAPTSVATPPAQPTPVPAEAIAEPPPEPEHHHHWVPSVVLGVAGLACAGVAVYGLVQVLHYDGEVNTINSHGTSGQFTQSQLQSDKSSAQLWQPLGIGLAVAAAAGLTGAVIVW